MNRAQRRAASRERQPAPQPVAPQPAGDEEDEIIVICSPWDQKCVPSVSVECRGCGRLLAMSRNVRKGLPTAVAECVNCAEDTDEPILLPQTARKEVIARLGFDPGTEAPASLKAWLKERDG